MNKVPSDSAMRWRGGYWRPDVFVRKGKRGRRYAGGGWVAS